MTFFEVTMEKEDAIILYTSANGTNDKINILSATDVVNSKYMFSTSSDSVSARVAYVSDYAKAKGIYFYGRTEKGKWWLSTTVSTQYYYANYVGYDGSIGESNKNSDDVGVRPIITIELK